MEPRTRKSGEAGPAVNGLNVDSLTVELERLQSTPGDGRSLDGRSEADLELHHASESAENVMRELTRHAIMAQQEAERRALLAEKLAEDMTVHHEMQKQQWLAMNASLRDHTSRLLEEARNTAIKKRKERRRKTTDAVDLEAQQYAAQQQADLLRAVVAPMEAEISDLKRRLVKAQKRSVSAASPDVLARDPLLPPAIDTESVFGSTAKVAELKAAQQELRAERQRRAETEIAVHLKETEIQVLIADLASVKMAYEQEKAKLADTRAARDTLAARTLAAIRELQLHCAQLERSGSSRAGGNGGGVAAVVAAEEGVGNGSSNAGSEARPVSDHLAAALLEVGELMASLRREHEAAKQAGNQDWALRRAQYESEAKALRVNLDAAHKRIATLEDTVADLNAAALKPCDYCADYEYKVVVMQEEVRQAHQGVLDTEAKVAVAVADVEKRIDEATLRNSRHLMRSMDDLERKMALKASRQLKAQDEQNAANTAVIKEALDKQAAAIEDLENALAGALPKVETQARRITELRLKLTDAEARASAAIKRHEDTLQAQSAARDQNRIILMQYKEERDVLKAELAKLRAAAAESTATAGAQGSSQASRHGDAQALAPRGGGGMPWWYWREDPERLRLHHPAWVLEDGFVAFPSAVSARIEAHLLGGTGGTLAVSLAPPPSTDPNAMHAPVEFELDLAARTQKNIKTGEVRPIARRAAPPGMLEGKNSPGRPRAQSMNAKSASKKSPPLSGTPQRSASSAVGNAIARVTGLASRRRSNSDVSAMISSSASNSVSSPSKAPTRSPPLSPRPTSPLSDGGGVPNLASSSNV